ncbi:MAG: protein kinase [Verrucomicrobiota bacterium]
MRLIGQGSYGDVWLARNMMGRYRAVKIVWRKSFKDERPFERELNGIRTFEPISRSYEGFLDVLHVGSSEKQGCFYYVMELGDDQNSGQDIDPQTYSPRTLAADISKRGRLPLQECLQLGVTLSATLAELHKHGLVHRDVKPSNIIFVGGMAKLADIGLVVEVDEARSYVGTEGFIPPEGPCTVQGDIYGLGKVLYEASTAKDRQDFPALPLEWEQSPEHAGLLELNEVILRACRRQASQRYALATDLLADLVLVANGKSVKRLRMLERRWSNVKRVVGILGLIAAIMAAVSYPAFRERSIAMQSRQRQIGADIAYGNRAMESGDLLGAFPYFTEALRLDSDPANQSRHRLRLGSVLAQCAKLVQCWSAAREVDAADFSPDGRQVLFIEWFGRARVFDIETGSPVTQQFGQSDGLCRGAFSPDGSLIVTASQDKTACLWRAKDGAKVSSLNHPGKVLSAMFSPDGHRIVTASIDRIVRVWNTQTGALELELQGHNDAVTFARFSPDGRVIVTTSRDGTARLWNASDEHALSPPLEHPSWVGYAAFSPDGQLVVTACSDHKARVWESATGRRIPPDLEHRDGVRSAEFSPDGRLIVTAGLDRQARLWLTENHQPLNPNPILRHTDRVTHALFHPDGHRIVTTCVDGTVRVWDLAGSAVAPSGVHRTLSGDGRRFLTLTSQGLQVWDTSTFQPVSPLIQPPRLAEDAKLNRDGTFVLTASRAPEASIRHSLEVWEAATGHQIGPPLPLTNTLSAVSLSADGKRLVAFSGAVAQAWDVQAGRPLAKEVLHEGNIESAVFSPDGKAVASCCDKVVRVWDAALGRLLFAPLKHAFPVVCAQFNADGSRLVTCGADPSFAKCHAQVWNTATGRRVGSPLKHNDGVLHACFNPEGSRLATASEDFTAGVWDATTGRPLCVNLNHRDQVRSVAFSPNGRLILTASADKTARVWSADTGEPLTPPLWHNAKLTRATFLAEGQQLIASDKQGNTWKWTLPSDRRAVEDLASLARLLCEDSAVRPDAVGEQKPESIRTIWLRLRRDYPTDFTTTIEQIAAWHVFQAEDSELRHQWFAAAFHLQHLLALRPGDQSLTKRLAQAMEHLKKAN